MCVVAGSETEDKQEIKTSEKKKLKPMTTAELFLQRQQTLAALKDRVASLCSSICEDPEQNVLVLKLTRVMRKASIYFAVGFLSLFSFES